MKFLLGEKIEMTQLWRGDSVVPVTKVSAGPCTVLQLKTQEKDGYSAVQVGYGSRRSNAISKAVLGHFKNLGPFRYVREFRLEKPEAAGELKAGDTISLKTFAVGDKLTVIGVSKGKGFQGVVKRHGFHGQDATHGNKDQLRASGSVGAGGIQHVLKGMRMSGRMGGDRVTLHDVEVVEVDEMNNTMFIKGAVPGARHGLIMLFAEGELTLGMPEAKVEEVVVAEEEPVVEETPVEEVTEEAKAEEVPVVEEAKVEETPVVETPVEEVKTEEAPAVEETPVTEEAK